MLKASNLKREIRLKGISVCRGIGIGKPFFFTLNETSIPEVKPSENSQEEILRYRQAIERSKLDVERLKQRMEHEKLTEGTAILDTHFQLLEDPLITSDIEKIILETSTDAETAFLKAMDLIKKRFETMRDTFFRERFKDLQDIGRRIISHLRHTVRISLADVPKGSIIFANELSASEAAEADPERVYAFVTESGGLTTHAAIIAKAKGIPYVARVRLDKEDLSSKAIVIVDGRTGEVIISPDPDTLAVYSHIQKQLAFHVAKLEHTAHAIPETYDGLHIRLCANVEALEEISLMHQYGAYGVGLLRSENVFMFKNTFPGEEEQYLHYRAFVDGMKGLPLVIRTFDVGGDKCFMGRMGGTDEPFFIGCRAIQILLQEQTIFKRQLKAILRVASEGNVSVLLPMVTSLPELRQAKELLEQAKEELKRDGILCPEKIRIGCMIEVPSAAVIADLLASECDFLSIGTNDLVHYSLAVDRVHQTAFSLSALCHPSLLRMIKMVVTEANLRGISVTVCGEVASDPRFIPLLLGLGVHELSVACRYIPLVKNAIRCTSAIEAMELAQRALSLSTPNEVQELLVETYRNTVPEDCFYNF